jgi:hypothetical protein
VKVHICRFDSADHVKGRKRTYAAVKAAVLAAGRFSVFEATATARDAQLFTELGRDPEIETLHDEQGFNYPWVGVRRRQA